MDTGTALGIAATAAFGILPIWWSSRHQRPPATPSAGSMSIRVSEHRSQRTYSRHEIRSIPPANPQDVLLAYGAALFAAAVVYWWARPYLLETVGGAVLVTAALTWTTRHESRLAEGRLESVLAVAALALLVADLFVLTFPGLPWGSGFRLGWTFRQGAQLHGPGFVLVPLTVLLATVTSLLLLITGPLAVMFYRSGDRSPNVGWAARWYSGAARLAFFGLRRGALWSAVGLASLGLGFAFGFPHLNPATLPTHLAAPTVVR